RPLLPLSRTARTGATGGARRNHPGQCQLAVAFVRDGADRTSARRTARARASIAEVGIRLRYARMTELTSLTIADARDGLRTRAFSAVELARAHLTAMEEARVLNAYVQETPERAAAMAQESDARLARNDARPLEGIPVAVKDMFCTDGVRTSACSHILDTFV